ncbi:hypothetical protein HDU98_001436, partial [Podochytrium sp. JEL0797]
MVRDDFTFWFDGRVDSTKNGLIVEKNDAAARIYLFAVAQSAYGMDKVPGDFSTQNFRAVIALLRTESTSRGFNIVEEAVEWRYRLSFSSFKEAVNAASRSPSHQSDRLNDALGIPAASRSLIDNEEALLRELLESPSSPARSLVSLPRSATPLQSPRRSDHPEHVSGVPPAVSTRSNCEESLANSPLESRQSSEIRPAIPPQPSLLRRFPLDSTAESPSRRADEFYTPLNIVAPSRTLAPSSSFEQACMDGKAFYRAAVHAASLLPSQKDALNPLVSEPPSETHPDPKLSPSRHGKKPALLANPKPSAKDAESLLKEEQAREIYRLSKQVEQLMRDQQRSKPPSSKIWARHERPREDPPETDPGFSSRSSRHKDKRTRRNKSHRSPKRSSKRGGGSPSDDSDDPSSSSDTSRNFHSSSDEEDASQSPSPRRGTKDVDPPSDSSPSSSSQSDNSSSEESSKGRRKSKKSKKSTKKTLVSVDDSVRAFTALSEQPRLKSNAESFPRLTGANAPLWTTKFKTARNTFKKVYSSSDAFARAFVDLIPIRGSTQGETLHDMVLGLDPTVDAYQAVLNYLESIQTLGAVSSARESLKNAFNPSTLNAAEWKVILVIQSNALDIKLSDSEMKGTIVSSMTRMLGYSHKVDQMIGLGMTYEFPHPKRKSRKVLWSDESVDFETLMHTLRKKCGFHANLAKQFDVAFCDWIRSGRLNQTEVRPNSRAQSPAPVPRVATPVPHHGQMQTRTSSMKPTRHPTAVYLAEFVDPVTELTVPEMWEDQMTVVLESYNAEVLAPRQMGYERGELEKIRDHYKQSVQCFHCKKYGHFKRDCPGLAKLPSPLLNKSVEDKTEVYLQNWPACDPLVQPEARPTSPFSELAGTLTLAESPLLFLSSVVDPHDLEEKEKGVDILFENSESPSWLPEEYIPSEAWVDNNYLELVLDEDVVLHSGEQTRAMVRLPPNLRTEDLRLAKEFLAIGYEELQDRGVAIPKVIYLANDLTQGQAVPINLTYTGTKPLILPKGLPVCDIDAQAMTDLTVLSLPPDLVNDQKYMAELAMFVQVHQPRDMEDLVAKMKHFEENDQVIDLPLNPPGEEVLKVPLEPKMDVSKLKATDEWDLKPKAQPSLLAKRDALKYEEVFVSEEVDMLLVETKSSRELFKRRHTQYPLFKECRKHKDVRLFMETMEEADRRSAEGRTAMVADETKEELPNPILNSIPTYDTSKEDKRDYIPPPPPVTDEE